MAGTGEGAEDKAEWRATATTLATAAIQRCVSSRDPASPRPLRPRRRRQSATRRAWSTRAQKKKVKVLGPRQMGVFILAALKQIQKRTCVTACGRRKNVYRTSLRAPTLGYGHPMEEWRREGEPRTQRRKVRGSEPNRSQCIGRMHQAATLRWTLPAPFLLICLTCLTQRLPNPTHTRRKGWWKLFCKMFFIFLTQLESKESIRFVNLRNFNKIRRLRLY